MNRFWLVLAAAAIGTGLVALKEVAFAWLTGTQTSYSSELRPVLAIVVATPFLILALIGARRPLPWAAGLLLTVLLWSYALFAGAATGSTPERSGFDLAVLMIVSPLLISPVVVAVHLAQRRALRRR